MSKLTRSRSSEPIHETSPVTGNMSVRYIGVFSSGKIKKKAVPYVLTGTAFNHQPV
jgi:hypothetical protein